MCGRFYVDDTDTLYRSVLAELYGDGTLDARAARGEIRPTDTVAVLTAEGARLMQWGFSQPGRKGVLINARSETVEQRATFRGPFRTSRCVIPAGAYFEWDRKSNKRTKYRVRPSDRTLFGLAGVYRLEADMQLPAFVVLTVCAPQQIAHLHDRTPVILPYGAAGSYLRGVEQARLLVKSTSGGLALAACSASHEPITLGV